MVQPGKSLAAQGLVAGFKDFMHLFNLHIMMLKLQTAVSSTELCQGRAKLMVALARSSP